jgi:hypothetical protein
MLPKNECRAAHNSGAGECANTARQKCCKRSVLIDAFERSGSSNCFSRRPVVRYPMRSAVALIVGILRLSFSLSQECAGWNAGCSLFYVVKQGA